MSAAEALGAIGDPRAIEPLTAVLNEDADEQVRAYAAEALGKIDDSRVVEPLIAALRDEESSVRDEAVKALSSSSDPRAVEALGTGCGGRFWIKLWAYFR